MKALSKSKRWPQFPQCQCPVVLSGSGSVSGLMQSGHLGSIMGTSL
jgi:hypothetical protein